MTVRISLTVAALAALLAACGDRAPDGAAGAPADADTPAGPLSLLLDVPDTVRAGQSVPITATLVNNGRDTVRLVLGGLGGSPSLDVEVTRLDGGLVWRRSDREPLPANPFDWTLKPGELFAMGYAWTPQAAEGEPLPPGTYRVRGIVDARPRDLATPTKTIVVARE